MYGAKGETVYVMGNAAGRPLINAVGRPRVVINGSCLDYLADSFMAGDPLNGGEFADMKPEDWELIFPYLQENQRLFGISIENDLLVVSGRKMDDNKVYRKVRAVRLKVLSKTDTEWGD